MQMTASCKNTRDTVSCGKVQGLSPKRRQRFFAWHNYAKFFMRTEKRHFEAEESLAFAFRVKPEGARVNECPFGFACP